MISCSCCFLYAFLNLKKNQKKGQETHSILFHFITTFMHILTPWTFSLRVSTWAAISSSSCKRSLYERFFSRCILPGASPSSTLRWPSRNSVIYVKWEKRKKLNTTQNDRQVDHSCQRTLAQSDAQSPTSTEVWKVTNSLYCLTRGMGLSALTQSFRFRSLISRFNL